MGKNKTAETNKSVSSFINAIKDNTKRNDSFRVLEIIEKKTGLKPKMWGQSIIGFGSYHYKYESGREGDSPLVAFSPRESAIVLYLSGNFVQREELLQNFGKHKTNKGCIYIQKLDDVSIEVFEKMIINHINHINSQNS